MKVCSLFAGSGGIDIAFEQAGFDVIWANEFDADACKTYRLNFPDVFLSEKDIRKVDASDIPCFDVLIGGFPCQPFSIMGKKQGFSDDRGNLFFEICRIIDYHKPSVVFLENVANLVYHDNGKTIRVIMSELLKRGYFIKHTVIDACNYGMAQHRTRTYIVCFRDSSIAERFEFPKPSCKIMVIKDIINSHILADKALYFEKGTEKYCRLEKFIDDEDQLYRFSDYGIQKSKDGISFTLKANMGTWYDREPIIKDDFGIRKLSPNECFALQGYPMTFDLTGIPVRSAYKQAGNTVCVPVVKSIADEIMRVLLNV